jgi:ABC-type glycerol-3-phosphate transport system permease component
MSLSKPIKYLLLTLAALSFLYPFYWMIVASLTEEAAERGAAFYPYILKKGILHGFKLVQPPY